MCHRCAKAHEAKKTQDWNRGFAHRHSNRADPPEQEAETAHLVKNDPFRRNGRRVACGTAAPAYIGAHVGPGSQGRERVLNKNQIEPGRYRDAMANFAGAVHIVTTDGAAGRRGVTVIAACSVSDEPPTILVCLNRQNGKNDAFRDNGVFALNTLAAEHQDMSADFAGLTGKQSAERFADGDWDTIATGAPTLVSALAVFDCELLEAKDLATHRVLFGRVTGLRVGDNLPPLIYHRRAWRVL